jgi:neopullulanase
MAPIIGNHDVPRIISDLQGDELWSPRTEPAREIDDSAAYALLKLAWTFLMTQPGAPVIYYGDELGMPGANDPDNRRNMRFGDELQGSEKDVLSHVQKLGKLRSCSDVIRLGQSSLEYVDDELYVYKKTLEEQEAWIYLNRSQNVRRTRYHPLFDLGWYSAFQQNPKLEGDLMVLEPRSSLILMNDLTCLETGL